MEKEKMEQSVLGQRLMDHQGCQASAFSGHPVFIPFVSV